MAQGIRIYFDNASAAEAEAFAKSLQKKLKLYSRIDSERLPHAENTQGDGEILQVILNPALLVALAAGITAWLKASNNKKISISKINTDKEGNVTKIKIIASGLNSDDVEKTLRSNLP